MSTNDTDITVELRETNFLTRWPCHVCGGCTEKHKILAEVLDGPWKGLRVCETCLEAGDIDARLERHAAKLEEHAAEVRSIVGRLKVPTFAEWEARQDRINVAGFAHLRAAGDDRPGLGDAEYSKVMNDDEAYATWRRLWDEELAAERERLEANKKKPAAVPPWRAPAEPPARPTKLTVVKD